LLYGGERLADVREGQPVWIVEGESKVDKLWTLGEIAVSGDSGAQSKWLPEHAELLRGLPVILWPDSDEAGEAYIANAATAIRALTPDADVRVVRPFPMNGGKGKDVCDWQGSAQELLRLAETAVPYIPHSRPEAGADGYEPPGEPLASQAPPKISHAKALQGKVFAPIKFIVKGYVVEGATLLGGRPKVGKSWLVLDWALAAARGGFCFGDVHCKEGSVLFLALEDNERRLKARINKILGDSNWPEKFEYATEWPRANEGALRRSRNGLRAALTQGSS
jgi:hypothetical protein